MRCPVCDENMQTQCCSCGYDRSLDYEQFPTFGGLNTVPDTVSRLREARKALVRCAGCGYHGFTMSRTTGKMQCIRCGQMPMETELKSVIAVLHEKNVEKQTLMNALRVKQGELDSLCDQLEGIRMKLEHQLSQEYRKRLELKKLDDALCEKEKLAADRGQLHEQIQSMNQDLEALRRMINEKRHRRDELHQKSEDAQRVLQTLNAQIGGKQAELDGLNARVAAAELDLAQKGERKKDRDCKDWLEEFDLVVAETDPEAARRIKAIAANDYVTVALYGNGSVQAIGSVEYGRCMVSEWRDVVAIAVCAYHTVGLTSEGKVRCTGKGTIPRVVSKWRDITAISANNTGVFGLKRDGTVLTVEGGVDKWKIAKWSSIKAISAGRDYLVGLRKDGTVVAEGVNDKGQCIVSAWKGIKSISAGIDCTIGIREDGSVVNTGIKHRINGRYAAIYQNIYKWENQEGMDLIYGLYEDRTAAGIYYYTSTYEEMKEWGKLEALTVVRGMVIGLKADGTVVSAGSQFTPKRDVSALNLLPA